MSDTEKGFQNDLEKAHHNKLSTHLQWIEAVIFLDHADRNLVLEIARQKVSIIDAVGGVKKLGGNVDAQKLALHLLLACSLDVEMFQTTRDQAWEHEQVNRAIKEAADAWAKTVRAMAAGNGNE